MGIVPSRRVAIMFYRRFSRSLYRLLNRAIGQQLFRWFAGFLGIALIFGLFILSEILALRNISVENKASDVYDFSIDVKTGYLFGLQVTECSGDSSTGLLPLRPAKREKNNLLTSNKISFLWQCSRMWRILNIFINIIITKNVSLKPKSVYFKK